MSILGVDFATILAQQLGPLLRPVALQKVTPGSYDPLHPTRGNQPVTTPYSCQGVASKFKGEFVAEDQVRKLEFEVLILLGTGNLNGAQPAPGDVVFVERPNTALVVRGNIYEVSVDPAGASATCKAHG